MRPTRPTNTVSLFGGHGFAPTASRDHPVQSSPAQAKGEPPML